MGLKEWNNRRTPTEGKKEVLKAVEQASSTFAWTFQIFTIPPSTWWRFGTKRVQWTRILKWVHEFSSHWLAWYEEWKFEFMRNFRPNLVTRVRNNSVATQIHRNLPNHHKIRKVDPTPAGEPPKRPNSSLPRAWTLEIGNHRATATLVFQVISWQFLKLANQIAVLNLKQENNSFYWY